MASNKLDPLLCDAIKRSRDVYKKASSSKPRKGKPNAVADFVSYPNGILKDFIDKFEESTEIKDQILECIPNQFQKSVNGYRILNNQLSLLVDNASSATQLRFVKTEILTNLRKNGMWNLSNITIKIDPNN